MKPKFSIIIPIRRENEYLRETLAHIKLQKYRSYEILVITDKLSGHANPAQKRNLGAKMAKGDYLAFIDDDSYPDPYWLQNTLAVFKKNPESAAVCGPCLTPPSDSVYQKASGLVHSSLLGSGGAGTYRNSISKTRQVDDYPSVNLIVRKQDFNKIKGFDTHHWPGEDTILCLGITRKLKKSIIYDPSIIVFHHRRLILIPHLQQISRYALHRGHFARIYPETSFRLGYILPSFFSVYLVTLILINNKFYFFPLYLYLILLTLTFFSFLFQKHPLISSLLAVITIPATHLTYGFMFICGFFKKNLKFIPHKTDRQGNYIGG